MSFVDDFPNMFFHDIWWFSQRHLDGRMDAQVGKAWEGRRNVAGLGCSMDEEVESGSNSFSQLKIFHIIRLKGKSMNIYFDDLITGLPSGKLT